MLLLKGHAWFTKKTLCQVGGRVHLCALALEETWQKWVFSLGRSFGFTEKLHSLKTTRDKWLWTALMKKGKPERENWSVTTLLKMFGRASFKIAAGMAFCLTVVSQQTSCLEQRRTTVISCVKCGWDAPSWLLCLARRCRAGRLGQQLAGRPEIPPLRDSGFPPKPITFAFAGEGRQQPYWWVCTELVCLYFSPWLSVPLFLWTS